MLKRNGRRAQAIQGGQQSDPTCPEKRQLWPAYPLYPLAIYEQPYSWDAFSIRLIVFVSRLARGCSHWQAAVAGMERRRSVTLISSTLP
jgi:hypothetical protein